MSQENVSRIVVGFDYSPTAVLALTRAFELAARDANGAVEVHVVTVIMMGEDFGYTIPPTSRRPRAGSSTLR